MHLLWFGDSSDRWHRQAIMVAVQELKELLAKNASGVLVDQPHLERTCDVFIRYADAGDDVWSVCTAQTLRAQLQACWRQRLRAAPQGVLSKSGHRRVSGCGQLGPRPVRRAVVEAHQRGQERGASVDQRM